MIEESDNEVRVGMSTIQIDLPKNTMIRIRKCGHYDVKSGTIGRFIKQKDGGIEVEVTGQFWNSNTTNKMEEKTVSVYVEHGDYELV